MNERIYNDLMVALKIEKFDAEDIADIICSMFEFTGNDRYHLWQVAEEIYKISLTPLEAENPFSIDDDFKLHSQELT